MQPNFTQAEGKPAFTAIHIILGGDNGIEESERSIFYKKEKVLWFLSETVK